MTNIELETMHAIKNAARKYSLIDWEEVRINAAIAALPQNISIANDKGLSDELAIPFAAGMAVRYADELVKCLKDG